ncbi:hypothetical protein [Actinomadura hibisca]|uniref:hypothetical protein n=1 Tax=Actinomadura hibisca TaxID=68565 RepID=UPI000829FE9F|nr:hypothetical protein [Actinomadura hibisca]
MHTLVNGLIAGAAGTGALNIASYLDMALRGRGASGTPEESVQKLADVAHVDLGEGERADHRKQALGALLGYATGMGVAVCFAPLAARKPPWPVGALALGALAMVGSNAPMTVLGITDPRTWSASGWISDMVPHLAYGIVGYTAFRHLS